LRAASVAGGAEVGSDLNMLMPTQLNSSATTPAISSSAPLFKRRRTGTRGAPSEIRIWITSLGVDGVPDGDWAAATEVACDSAVFTTAVCGTADSAGASRSAAGSDIADHRRSVPGRHVEKTFAGRRRHLRSISGNKTN